MTTRAPVPDVICNVTVLGSRRGGAGAAARAVVNYLDGRGTDRHQQTDEPRPDRDNESTSRYYTDSIEGPGVWIGGGAESRGLAGTVEGEHLRRILSGEDPFTGEQLLEARGSAGRADRFRHDQRPAPTRGDVLGLRDAALIAKVDAGYLRRIAGATAAARASGSPVPATWLDATKTGPSGRWEVAGDEVDRFVAARHQPTVVVGYDVTFSAPKSVSVLWATADGPVRAQIIAAIDASVGAGIDYLERNACTVRTPVGLAAGEGFTAASFLHATNRNLEPQLHRHVVVANVVTGPAGVDRALEARGLFGHARTAGHLAAAELRNQLTNRLGVSWDPVRNGVADITGVPVEARAALSTRSAEIDEVARAAGLGSASARQVAAYATRAAKVQADPSTLRAQWQSTLASAGFTVADAEQLLGRVPGADAVSAGDVAALFTSLAGPGGVTEHGGVFDRRQAVCAIAEWGGDRLPADDVEHLADIFLASEEVIALAARPDPLGGVRYTTRSMLAAERAVLDGYRTGLHAGAAIVRASLLDLELARHPTLGADQVVMVRAICTSGHRVQCVLGPAGSGKTFALHAACRAWEDSGYRVVGAAVGGTAAELLGARCAIPSTTVASLLTRLDTATDAVLDPRTVVIVDEASTLGTRDWSRLQAHLVAAGATLRLVGDPAQHAPVAAGGAWRHLLDAYPEHTPALIELRRQQGPAMADVRLALGEYRDGAIGEALARLGGNDRIVEAESADELLDALVADWYVDRTARIAEPDRPPSSMIAEHHIERTELNDRARALLSSDGTLRGPALIAGGQSFCAGDEVIARTQARELRPPDGDRNSWVRNGTRGTVVDVTDRGLIVDFERRGTIEVPTGFLERELRPGVTGGLTHAYCLTSHAAQGETYRAARHLGTDRSSREGVYVGLSRGQADARLYIVRVRDVAPEEPLDPGLPRLERDTADARNAFTRHLHGAEPERMAIDHDARAAAVAELLEQQSPPAIATLAATAAPDSPEARAWHLLSGRVAATAILLPEADVVAGIGARPAAGDSRDRWDTAVAARAVHLLRYDGTAPTPEAAASAENVAGLLASVVPPPMPAPAPELAMEAGIGLS